jgi:hypothetical protein
MGGSDIERYRQLQKASPRPRKHAGPRELAEPTRQFAVLDGGAMQRKRVLI